MIVCLADNKSRAGHSSPWLVARLYPDRNLAVGSGICSAANDRTPVFLKSLTGFGGIDHFIRKSVDKLWYDCETFSPVNIRDGTYKYTSNSEIMLVTYAINDGPVYSWDRTEGDAVPGELKQALQDPAVEIWAHNSMFDRTVLSNGIPDLCPPIERWRDTMIQAYMCSLPGALDKLCQALNVGENLSKMDGKKLIRLFCIPQKSGPIVRPTRLTHPEEWARFVDYAKGDITAMRECHRLMPKWNMNKTWLGEWYLDQKINDRGFFVDTELATAAIESVKREQIKLSKKTQDATSGDVASTTQRDALLEHILAHHGVALPDMKKGTLQRRIEDPDLPQGVRDLIAIRLQQSASSTSKYAAVIKAVQPDGRCRGTIQFGGASRTLRAAGRTFQPHNLPSRGLLPANEIEDGIECMKEGTEALFYDNVMHLASSAIRGLLVAPPGKKLVVSDLSNIEGRFAAWIADEQWKLQAFKDYDTGDGHDLYKLSYAKSFHVKPEEVTKPQRDIGKVQELMLQYAGGVGAYVTGALGYRFDIEDMAQKAWDEIPIETLEQAEGFYEWALKKDMPSFGLSKQAYIVCDAFKRLWRESNSNITTYWDTLHNAITNAVAKPGKPFVAGALLVQRDGSWLRIRLPSGRYLCYPSIRVNDDGEVSYLGVNQYTKRWDRIGSWKGKFFENVCQAGSRDVLYHPMQKMEDAGYKIVLHVHDEVVVEVPDTAEYNIEKLDSMLSEGAGWTTGLPLSAAGFETYRYRKG